MAIYSIQEIVDYMESVCPSKPQSNYSAIAKKYIGICVYECLRGFYTLEDQDNELIDEEDELEEQDVELFRDTNTIPFRLTNLNNNILNRFNGTEYWLPHLRTRFEFFRVFELGRKLGDYSKISRVKPFFSQTELLMYLYQHDQKPIVDLVNVVEYEEELKTEHIRIDLANLKRYINNLMMSIATRHYQDLRKIQNNIFKAKVIYDLAKHNGGYLTQQYSIKDTGRMYCKGINLQNCNGKVREAALGECHKYDLCSSMFAVMLGVIAENRYIDDDYLKQSYLAYMIQNKKEIRHILARECLTDTPATHEQKIKYVKGALQKLGFGCDPRRKDNGIKRLDIWNEADRERFTNHWIVVGLLKEIALYKKIMDEYHDDAKKRYGDSIKKNGRYRKNKWYTYHYQFTESAIIQAIKQQFGEDHIILQVHDALYFSKKPDHWEMNSIAKKISPFCEFDYEFIKAEGQDAVVLKEIAQQDSDHAVAIAQEEQLATQYANRYSGQEKSQIYSTDWNRLYAQNGKINRTWKKLSK